MKKFDSKAPFYSDQQKEKFVDELMRKVFKYSREEHTRENFLKIWNALDMFGLGFIAHTAFGGTFKDMKPEYKADYVAVLKRYFNPEWLAPFDGLPSAAKINKIKAQVLQAIEQAGYDSVDIGKRNPQEIRSVAIAAMEVLRDVEVLNSFDAFKRFLRLNGAVMKFKGVTYDDDNDAIVAEVLRNVRINLWKGKPDNEYTYYR